MMHTSKLGSAAVGDSPPTAPTMVNERWLTWRHIRVACSVFVSLVLGAFVLLASRATVNDFVLPRVGEIAAITLFFGYLILRCVGVLGPGSLPLVCACFAWLLALRISLSPPSRQHLLRGEGDSAKSLENEPCEDGTGALWIGLLVVFVSGLGPLRAWQVWLLGQVVAAQHFVAELILPRPECGAEQVPRDVMSTLLGLSPAFVSAFQLSGLAILLAAARPPERIQRSLTEYLQWVVEERSRSGPEDIFWNWHECLVNDIEQEEERCRELLAAASDLSLLAPPSDMLADWLHVTSHFANVLSRCSKSLRDHASRDHSKTTDEKVIEAAAEQFGAAVSCVSGFLDTSHIGRIGTDTSSRNRRSNIAKKAPDRWGIGDWSFDALSVEREHGHVLQLVGSHLLTSLSSLPTRSLADFLEHLEEAYIQENPYHSHIHAADMCNGLFYLMTKSGVWEDLSLSSCRRASILIAALGHDVGHVGRNNAFLVNVRHPLALTYNDLSVLENFHAATLTRMLDDTYGDEEHKAAMFSSFAHEDLLEARELIISLILATDMQKHFEALSSFRLRLRAETFDPFANAKDRREVLSIIFHTADLGHSAKFWDIHKAWALRVVEEFHVQGDHEKQLGMKVSPLCDRDCAHLAQEQVGFLQFMCLPLWTELVRLEQLMPRTRSCESEWTSEGSGTTHTSVRSVDFTQRQDHLQEARQCRQDHDTVCVQTSLRNTASVMNLRTLMRVGGHSRVHPSVSDASTSELSSRPERQLWLKSVFERCELNLQGWKRQLECENMVHTNTGGSSGLLT